METFFKGIFKFIKLYETYDNNEKLTGYCVSRKDIFRILNS
jgi:hypothetical protein